MTLSAIRAGKARLPEPAVMQPSSPTIRWVTQISEIDREAWDALALPLKTPFLRVGLAAADGGLRQHRRRRPAGFPAT
ncbi:MAG: hypothetical protein MZV70_40285 [Desulfobacterales bacterium]|nr:hypothetical protein [Desulfobacterales bacterium]